MKKLPKELKAYYFPFNWCLEKLWSLDVPITKWNLPDLEWHLDIPIWSSQKGKMLFDLHPRKVLNCPGKYKYHDERIEQCDISFPLDIMYSVDRYVIIDGIHRLAKHKLKGKSEVLLRVVPRELIPQFERT